LSICGAISKYGIDNFTLYILETLDSKTLKVILSQRENHWYELINPSYNLQSILQTFTGQNHYRFVTKLPEAVRQKKKNK
jgi:hypothetical protein